MADQQPTSWGLFPRVIVAAVAAMVISLALKPYQGKIAPYVNKIRESGIAKVSLDPSTSDKRVLKRAQEPGVRADSDLVPASKPKDKLTETDKTQLKSVLDKL